ncbi:MAG TPA: DUF1698 domain-containing protein, partial [Rhodothermales bacterium]
MDLGTSTNRALRRVYRALGRLSGKKMDVSCDLPSARHLLRTMSRYRTDHLVGLDAVAFESEIRRFLTLDDFQMEGQQNPVGQRDLTRAFHWGHDHDFGSFRLEGRMGTRHLRHLAEFTDRFCALPSRLDGLRILDIGCWTGGTSLLLCAMGAAEVVAIDEVKKYVECLQFLKKSFAIDNLEPRHLSLYDLVDPAFQDRFDLVLFAGVLYHVTDPIVALRITFNCLRDGGQCLVETTGHVASGPLISYARRQW